MRRGIIALAVGLTLGLGAAAPALAAGTLASSGDATSITATSANLNGVVYRESVGARWFFQYSTSQKFDAAVLATTPVPIPGRLSAVEREVTGLTPDTTYYWRVVLVVRSGTQIARSFGATAELTTVGPEPQS